MDFLKICKISLLKNTSDSAQEVHQYFRLKLLRNPGNDISLQLKAPIVSVAKKTRILKISCMYKSFTA